MAAPDVTAKSGYGNCITKMRYNDKYPIHRSELHLVRANYQINGIAMRLAQDGKLFTTLKDRRGGWIRSELELVNAIISLQTGRQLTMIQLRAIVDNFPEKILDLPCTKEEYFKNNFLQEQALGGGVVEIENWKPDKHTIKEVISWYPSDEILEILQSQDPTFKMKKNSKIFRAKINGVKDRRELIDFKEARNRRVMTIHGAKGLEALGVFLHTAITQKIKRAIVIPKGESRAEARVWYVGATRAIEHLYIVQDEGNNYKLPVIPKALADADITGIDLFSDGGEDIEFAWD